MTHDKFMKWKAETSLQDVIEICCNPDKIVVEFKGSTLKWWKEATQNKLLTEKQVGELHTAVLKLAVEEINGATLPQLTSLRRRYLNLYHKAGTGIMYEKLYEFFGGKRKRQRTKLKEIQRLSLVLSHLVKRDIVQLVRKGRERHRDKAC